MKKIASAGLLFLLCVLLAYASCEEEPAAVRVESIVYPRSLVQFTLTTMLDLNEANGVTLSDEDKAALAEDSLMRYVDLGIIEMKLEEVGQNEFTDEEMKDLELYAEEAFETVWQGLYTLLKGEDDSVTEKDVSEWLISREYSIEHFLQDAMASVRLERALALFCSDVVPSENEILAYYEQSFIDPDRAAYENNVPLYEKEILIPGNEAFYVPEGYIRIKHILLDFPKEVKEAMIAAAEEISKAEEARKTAYNELAEAAANGLDIVTYKEAYDGCVAVKEQKIAIFEEEMAKAVPALKEVTDRIYERLKNGESFETLMSEYSIDPEQQATGDAGYLFHPESEQWAESFREAAAKLKKEGDLSEPVLTDAGVHIIRYMSAVKGGVHQLTDAEQQALRHSALKAKRTEALNEKLKEWRGEYDWEIHAELLNTEE